MFSLKHCFALTFCALCQIAAAQIAPGAPADFGTIKEAEGPKSIRIYVTNVGTEPTALLKVKPTCGCTAVSFMEEKFEPGDSAWIDLTYDPSRRPGRFEKGVKVYPVNGDMIRIPITGVVLATPETVSTIFPIDASPLHLTEKTLISPVPLDKEPRKFYIDVYNSGQEDATYSLLSQDEAVTTHILGNPLPPGERGLITITVDPKKEERTGKLEYSLQLTTGSGSSCSESNTPGLPVEIKIITEK